MATMEVGLVSPEREIWSGAAEAVFARTLDGELGVLPGHIPLLGVLTNGGVVRIKPADGGAEVVAAVHGGFLSVSKQGVSILAETAELAAEIDVERARASLAAAAPGSDEARRAEARISAAGL